MRRTQEVDHEALLLSLAHSAAIDATNPARPPVREYIRNNGRSISRNRHLARKGTTDGIEMVGLSIVGSVCAETGQLARPEIEQLTGMPMKLLSTFSAILNAVETIEGRWV
jgi:hypothetical protein